MLQPLGYYLQGRKKLIEIAPPSTPAKQRRPGQGRKGVSLKAVRSKPLTEVKKYSYFFWLKISSEGLEKCRQNVSGVQGSHSPHKDLCFDLKHRPDPSRLKRPLPNQALPPIGSEGTKGTDCPFETSRPSPRSSPDQPLLPRAAWDWRAGGGPGAGLGTLHPLLLQLLLQPCAQPGAERISPSGTECAERAHHEARYGRGI